MAAWLHAVFVGFIFACACCLSSHHAPSKTTNENKVAPVKPPMAVTNAVSWRSEGIRHKKNEVFLDVVESVNLLVGSTGAVVSSEVAGVLKMRTFLSGMPECKLGLNDKVLFEAQGRAGRQKAVEMEDVRFHQCVRLVRLCLFFVGFWGGF
jgi:AP-1 complex subunit mu